MLVNKNLFSIVLILGLFGVHLYASRSGIVLYEMAKLVNHPLLHHCSIKGNDGDTIILPEINVVNYFDYQTKKIGYYEKNFLDLRRNSIKLGSYYKAICIQFEGGPFLRKNILESIRIDAKKKDSQCLLRLYFKEIDKFGLPGRTLYSLEDPIDPFESVIDLSKYQITVPKNDFYLCLEIIENAEMVKDDSKEDMFVRGNRLSIGATENKYETDIFIGSIHHVGWMKSDRNLVPRIELIVKGFN